MTNETQYVVPVYRENDATWVKIAMLTQPLRCLYDDYGNLNRCGFGRVKHDLLGEFYVFQSLDKKVAEEVREQLLIDKELNVLPMKEAMYALK